MILRQNNSVSLAVSLLLLFFFLGTSAGRCGVDEAIVYLNAQLALGRKVAMLMIDMQPSYLDEVSSSVEFGNIIMDQGRLLDAMVGKSGVYFIDITYGADSAYFFLESRARQLAFYGRLIKYHRSAFHREAHYITHIDARSGEERPSIIDTSLEQFLKSNHVDELFVFGGFDGVCVYQTVRDGLKKGFSVIVDRDLNVIFRHISKGAGKITSRASQQEFLDERWLKLSEQYEKLRVIQPVRYGSCTP